MATKTAKKVTAKTLRTTDTLRKGLRAYIGMYGAAYERVQPVFVNASKAYDAYADKGEKLELVAQTYAKDTRVFAKKTYGVVSGKVRSVLPTSANDRVVELEAELANLNAKLVKLTKTTKRAQKKTVKKAVKKTTATPSTTVKTETVVETAIVETKAA